MLAPSAKTFSELLKPQQITTAKGNVAFAPSALWSMCPNALIVRMELMLVSRPVPKERKSAQLAPPNVESEGNKFTLIHEK